MLPFFSNSLWIFEREHEKISWSVQQNFIGLRFLFRCSKIIDNHSKNKSRISNNDYYVVRLFFCEKIVNWSSNASDFSGCKLSISLIMDSASCDVRSTNHFRQSGPVWHHRLNFITHWLYDVFVQRYCHKSLHLYYIIVLCTIDHVSRIYVTEQKNIDDN